MARHTTISLFCLPANILLDRYATVAEAVARPARKPGSRAGRCGCRSDRLARALGIPVHISMSERQRVDSAIIEFVDRPDGHLALNRSYSGNDKPNPPLSANWRSANTGRA